MQIQTHTPPSKLNHLVFPPDGGGTAATDGRASAAAAHAGARAEPAASRAADPAANAAAPTAPGVVLHLGESVAARAASPVYALPPRRAPEPAAASTPPTTDSATTSATNSTTGTPAETVSSVAIGADGQLVSSRPALAQSHESDRFVHFAVKAMREYADANGPKPERADTEPPASSHLGRSVAQGLHRLAERFRLSA